MMSKKTVAFKAVEIPEKTGPPPISDDTHPGEIVSWTAFTEKTTFHGVRYIFQDSDQKLRRPIWLSVVITALLVFVIQVGIRTGNYFEYKTTVDVGVFFEDSLEFPAVTICNQNRYRITAVVDHGLYDVIDEVFKRSNISEIPWEEFGDRVNGIDYGEYTLLTGHQKELFIDSCTWNGIECDIDRDFKTVLTDLGLCYSFNAQTNVSAVHTSESGAGSGLRLVINVEQYEYMRGPQNDAGIKILLHPREETPLMKEQGFAAAPGTHTLVAMKRFEVTTLQPPYGACHPDDFPVSQCHAQCQALHVIKKCGCRAEYMEPIPDNTTNTCDLKTSLSCVRQTQAEMKKSELECQCSPPCRQIHYEPKLSYALLSKFNIDRMILENPKKQKELIETYLKARETTQRNRDEIRIKDKKDMTRLMNIADRLHSILQNNTNKVIDSLVTSHHYNLPAIIVQEPLQMDINTIIDTANKVLSYFEKGLGADTYSTYGLTLSLETIEKDFLQWDGSVSNFGQFLIACLEEATAAQQSDRSVGSGATVGHFSNNTALDYMNATFSNKTIMDYVSPKCKAEIQVKVEMMHYHERDFNNSFKESFDIQEKEADYHNTIANFFQNSTKTAEAFDGHKTCLHVLGLGDEVEEAFSELYNYTQSFTKTQTLEDYIWTTNKIINITVKGLVKPAAANLTACEWVRETLVEILWELDFYEAKVQAFRSNARLMYSFTEMSDTMVSMTLDFELLVTPIFEIIAAYMDGNTTKTDLAALMHSPLTLTILGELAAFEIEAYTVIRSLQEKLIQFKHSLIPIYVTIAESRIPLMTMEQIKNLEFFKLTHATNRTEFQDLIDGLPETMTQNLRVLIDLVFSEYDQEFQAFLHTILGPFKEISYYLTMLRGDLKEYAESSSLNVNFFMENFLQVDIFYKHMAYELIAQQEAFGLLSLLGEVGGFMGLLLGASVITVCELLDYVLLNVLRGCARRKKVAPNVVNVKQASA